MIPYSDLSELDFQIINEVYKMQSMTVEELQCLFPNQQALQLRLELLSKPDHTSSSLGLSFPIENTSYIEFEYITESGKLGAILKRTNKIHITALGTKAIEDWKLQRAKESRKLWESRFWKLAPIIISILAFIEATLSLAQALHWIDIAQ